MLILSNSFGLFSKPNGGAYVPTICIVGYCSSSRIFAFSAIPSFPPIINIEYPLCAASAHNNGTKSDPEIFAFTGFLCIFETHIKGFPSTNTISALSVIFFK